MTTIDHRPDPPTAPEARDRPAQRADVSIEAERMQASLESKLFASAPTTVRVGRFTLIDPIGQGAMGIVYRAFDPDLDRTVALKLLARSNPDNDARMLEEARALARLNHPHVVTIHEVGIHHERLFLAMEYVQGVSLDRWLPAQLGGGRGWLAQMESLLRQVAAGLHAAHQAGIVHRDVKPANILMGDDGRVRLADFGLARTDETPSLSSRSDLDDGEGALLTRSGEVAGTPAYMAPEQFEGLADARSDQFGLCATFYELLHGTRPFPGDTLSEVVERVSRGEPAQGPRSGSIPRSLQQILSRGLRRDPAERFADLGELLAALDRARTMRRRRWQVAGLLATAAAFAGSWSMAQRDPHTRACTGAAEAIEPLWGPQRRRDLAIRWDAAPVEHAADTWSRVSVGLDDYAQAWVAQHTEACEATAIRKEQSTEVLDARMRCLQRAAVGLSAVVDRLERPDRELATRAHRLVEGLPPLERCTDLTALDREPVDPQVEDIERQVAVARVAIEAGDRQASIEDLRRLAGLAEQLGHHPLHAKVSLELGSGLDLAGRYDDAMEQLGQAVRLGLSAERPWIARDAASRMVHLAGTRAMNVDAAQAWASVAWGLLEQRPDALAEARLRQNLGGVANKHEDFPTAIAEHRAALELFEREGATLRLASARVAIGHDLSQQGDHIGAEAEFRAALDHFQQHLGPKHPNVAGALTSLGQALRRQGRLEEAEDIYRRALEIWSATLDPEHPHLGMVHLNLGNALRAQSRYSEAEAEYQQALRIYRVVYGPGSSRTIGALLNLGLVALHRGDAPAAEPILRDALAQTIEALGPEHPRTMDARHNLGDALRVQGKTREAEAEYRAALALVPSDAESPHPMRPMLHAALGLLAQSEGRLDDAVEQLRRAVTLYEQILAPDAPELVGTRTELGLVLLQRDDFEGAERLLRGKLPPLSPDANATNVRVARAHVALAHAQARGANDQLEHAMDRLARARATLESEGTDKSGAVTLGLAHATLVEAELGWSSRARRAELRARVHQARRELDAMDGRASVVRRLLDRWLEAHP